MKNKIFKLTLVVTCMLLLGVFLNKGVYAEEKSGGKINSSQSFDKAKGYSYSALPHGITRSSLSGRWIQSRGRWWYQHIDGSYTRNGWEMINGKWYLFDSAGWMLTSWQNFNDKWYFLADSGEMLVSWQYINGKWYYLDSSGAMLTGLITVGTDKFYMNQDGSMFSGWKYLNGNYCYFGEDGRYVSAPNIKRRALLLGETSTKAVPKSNIYDMKSAMESNKFNGKGFEEVVDYSDNTKSDIVNKINSLFNKSEASDINYIYITCHGADSLLLIGSDKQGLTGQELRSLLINKKGLFVIMIDSCHSGSFIDKSVDDSFIRELLGNTERSRELCDSKFMVLTSSSSGEVSIKPEFDQNSLATSFWVKGIGGDGYLAADSNSDSKVTFRELYQYSSDEVKEAAKEYDSVQNVQEYADLEDFVIFGRY